MLPKQDIGRKEFGEQRSHFRLGDYKQTEQQKSNNFGM